MTELMKEFMRLGLWIFLYTFLPQYLSGGPNPADITRNISHPANSGEINYLSPSPPQDPIL
jgi:hypothetical protein